MLKSKNAIRWIKDETDPQCDSWEEFYRNRWQHDKVVRSTHGVNCTGGCTWNIHVKDGIVTWEMQGLDYPLLESGIPPYEPRGCQRGISYSWYLYSPLRVKYPYIRGALIDLWRAARAESQRSGGRLEESMVEDPTSRATLAKGTRQRRLAADRLGHGAWRSSPRRWFIPSRSTVPTVSPASRPFPPCR